MVILVWGRHHRLPRCTLTPSHKRRFPYTIQCFRCHHLYPMCIQLSKSLQCTSYVIPTASYTLRLLNKTQNSILGTSESLAYRHVINTSGTSSIRPFFSTIPMSHMPPRPSPFCSTNIRCEAYKSFHISERVQQSVQPIQG